MTRILSQAEVFVERHPEEKFQCFLTAVKYRKGKHIDSNIAYLAAYAVDPINDKTIEQKIWKVWSYE